MTCEICGDLGMLILPWTDARPLDDYDFAVCLCPAGQVYRHATNNGRRVVPLWRVWCAREQVDPARVFLLEHIYTREELAAVGLSQTASPANRVAALLAAGRRSKL